MRIVCTHSEVPYAMIIPLCMSSNDVSELIRQVGLAMQAHNS